VAVPTDGLLRSSTLQPLFVIGMQTPLVIVDEHAGGDMHGVYKAQLFPDPTLAQALFTYGVMLINARRPVTWNQSSLR
jgi:hypothetical protein